MDKEIFLQWLKDGSDWQQGLDLYKKHGNNAYYLRNMRLRGESKATKESLRYDLMRLCGLREKELTALLSAQKAGRPKKEDTLIREAYKGNKTAIRLRDEFPFLGDEDCPDVLKVLISDMLSSYDRYRKAYKELDGCPEDECLNKAGEVVENFLNNREIWQELNYYKEHKKLLGNHPVFDRIKRQLELSNMSIKDLVRLQENTKFNIWRNNSLIEKADKPHLNLKRRQHIDLLQQDLKEINRILG